MSAMHSARDGLAVRLDAVTCVFGAVTALRDVTCHMEAGTIFGLVGPNGAGKSTWVRGLLGLIQPVSGRITVGSYQPFGAPGTVRRQCSALLSPSGLYDHLTAEEHLDLVGRIWHMPRADMALRVQAVLEPFGLWSRRRDSVSQWSQGMRQQLALAKTLFVPTPLLLLDEPTTCLDPDARHHVVRLLKEHWACYQPTILVTSHDLSFVEDFCQVIGILNKGCLLAVAPPDVLRNSQHHPEAIVRVSHASVDLLERLSRADSVIRVTSRGDTADIAVLVPGVNDVLTWVMQSGADIDDVKTAPTMDESVRRILGGLTE